MEKEIIRSEANRVIDGLGGTVAVSALCNITTGAVSQWRNNGIPDSRMMYFMVIRPDLFNKQKEKIAA